jgi:hypothetical protein
VTAAADNRLPGMKFPRSSFRHCGQDDTAAKDENHAPPFQPGIRGIGPHHARAFQKWRPAGNPLKA